MRIRFLFLLSRLAELQLKGLDDCKENWTDIDSIDRVFCCKRTAISGFVISQTVYHYFPLKSVITVEKFISEDCTATDLFSRRHSLMSVCFNRAGMLVTIVQKSVLA